MFVGFHAIAMDNKGRVIIPQEYRDEFGEKVVVTNGPDKCLNLFTQETWKERSEKIAAIPEMNSARIREIKRFFFKNTSFCDIDKQGRILIPKNHREYAGIESGVEFVGMGNTLELWSDSEYKEPGEGQNISDMYAALAEFGI